MKKIYNKHFKTGTLLAAAFILLICACQKDKYYFDGGKSDPIFKGTALQYLESKPFNFDTIAAIIKIAGLEKELTNDTLTFFAPQDYSVAILLNTVNANLYLYGKDSVRRLEDIDPSIWRKYLQGYLFKGMNKLNDYPQLDVDAFAIFPGQNYMAYNKEVYNIGVNYAMAGSVKYSGYRQIQLSYFTNVSEPFNTRTWQTASVTSSDIQADHSVIHVLGTISNVRPATHYFGFDVNNFVQDVLLSK